VLGVTEGSGVLVWPLFLERKPELLTP
jgi:hypothetical protein